MDDREIINNFNMAVEYILDQDQTKVKEGMSLINQCHTAIYEACCVSRDVYMGVADDVDVITRITKISRKHSHEKSMRSTINSITDLVQQHLEYYA